MLASDTDSAEVKARLAKFELSAPVQDEGANFSAGERQLIALARVVVRNNAILVLDEATASLDVETDQAIQSTIKAEFKDTTLLCIVRRVFPAFLTHPWASVDCPSAYHLFCPLQAHRLATVAYYDRIIVLEKGEVVEFDTPLALFDLNGIFRSMCGKASLSREDIVKIRAA